MRTQGQARFSGQADWKASGLGSATQVVLDACAKEREVPETKYSAGFSAIVGITLSLGTLIGLVVYELVRHGN